MLTSKTDSVFHPHITLTFAQEFPIFPNIPFTVHGSYYRLMYKGMLVITSMIYGCTYKQSLFLAIGGHLEAGGTLWWGYWVPGSVGAVIVDHVVDTNPPVSSILKGVEGLV